MYKKSLLIFFSIIFVLVALCLKWYIQRQVMISHFFHLQKKIVHLQNFVKYILYYNN